MTALLAVFSLAAIVWGGVNLRRLSTRLRQETDDQMVATLMKGFRIGVRIGQALPDADPEEVAANLRDVMELASAKLKMMEEEGRREGGVNS